MSMFLQLVEQVSCSLTKSLYILIPYLQQKESEFAAENHDKNKRKKGLGATGKTISKGKAIPNLVYLVESYERYLILLGKKCKVKFAIYQVF